MALRFGHNAYWCWSVDEETRGIIGLSPVDENRAAELRDGLSDYLSSGMSLEAYKEQDANIPSDSTVVLFDADDACAITRFYESPRPGPLAQLIDKHAHSIWAEEASRAKRLVKVEIETNHDFPGLLIYSTAMTIEQMDSAIRDVATMLGLALCQSSQLGEVNIFSNRVVTCDE